MTPAERERIARLVEQIQIERDRKKFTELISALNALLAQKEKALEQSGTSITKQ